MQRELHLQRDQEKNRIKHGCASSSGAGWGRMEQEHREGQRQVRAHDTALFELLMVPHCCLDIDMIRFSF